MAPRFTGLYPITGSFATQSANSHNWPSLKKKWEISSGKNLTMHSGMSELLHAKPEDCSNVEV